MADDKKQNGNNTNPNNANVNKPVQQTPAPRGKLHSEIVRRNS